MDTKSPRNWDWRTLPESEVRLLPGLVPDDRESVDPVPPLVVGEGCQSPDVPLLMLVSCGILAGIGVLAAAALLGYAIGATVCVP